MTEELATHDAIADLLVTDAEFVAEIQALGLGAKGEAVTPKVLRTWRPLGSLGSEHLPAQLLEIGDAESVEQTVGSYWQAFDIEILLAYVWHQQDYETSYRQRLGLLGALTRLFLRNPCPGDAGDCFVSASANDRAVNHPRHIATFRITARVAINRS